MPAFQDLTGQRFGRLTVISRSENRGKKRKETVWKCQCDCGNFIETRSTGLKSKNTKSCGCYKMDKISKHGLWKDNRKMHRIWLAMKQRCYNSKQTSYGIYGARGITVCERWRYDFEAFFSDMGPHPGPEFSIDRIDVNEGYSPENCRWATRKEQNRNTRTNHIITYNGKTQCVQAWANDIGISSSGLRFRLKKGWSIEKALTAPLRPGFRQH